MRLFFGIELDERSLGAAVFCMNEAKHSADGRFVTSSNLHMTLCFIGEVASDAIAEIDKIAQEAASSAHSCELTLSGLGFFGKPADAILYIGVEGAESLKPLSDSLKTSLRSAGLPCDPKPFSPHITIARKAAVSQSLLDGVAPEKVSWKAEKLTLFDSARISGVLTYTPIRRWSLTGN